MPLEFKIMVDLSPSSTTGGGSFALAHSTDNNITDFFGACAVFSMESGNGDISADEIREIIEEESKSFNENYDLTQRRFLFKTKSDDGTGGRFLSSGAIKVLSDAGSKLVGIDMAGLTKESLLEEPPFSYIVNLRLDFVKNGQEYKLLAAPLLMQDLNPVPVRPILVY